MAPFKFPSAYHRVRACCHSAGDSKGNVARVWAGISYSARTTRAVKRCFKPYLGPSFGESRAVSINFYGRLIEFNRSSINFQSIPLTNANKYSQYSINTLLTMADALKAEGNKAFAAKNFEEAA